MKNIISILFLTFIIFIPSYTYAQERPTETLDPASKGPIETLERVKQQLHEIGINEEQMKGTLSSMRRMISDVKKDGSDFEVNPFVVKYLSEKLGLSKKQIAATKGMSISLAANNETLADEDPHAGHNHGPGGHDHNHSAGDGHDHSAHGDHSGHNHSSNAEEEGRAQYEAILGHLMKNGFSKKQADDTLMSFMTMLGELPEDPNDFKIEGGLKEHYTNEVGLDDKQINFLEKFMIGLMKER